MVSPSRAALISDSGELGTAGAGGGATSFKVGVREPLPEREPSAGRFKGPTGVVQRLKSGAAPASDQIVDGDLIGVLGEVGFDLHGFLGVALRLAVEISDSVGEGGELFQHQARSSCKSVTETVR